MIHGSMTSGTMTSGNMVAGTTIMIEGIKFKILSLDVIRNNSTYGGISSSYHIINSTDISMVAETTTNYYMTLENWIDMFDSNGRSKPAFSFKKNIIKNGIQIMGIFPRDYIFKDNNIIEVTFSIDHFSGDMKLFNRQQERMQKLNKLNNICQ